MIKRQELAHPSSCLNRAREDEMVFVLLGRDAAAPAAIRAWIEERIRLGKNQRTDEQIVEAEAAIGLFIADAFSHDNGCNNMGGADPATYLPCSREKGHEGPCAHKLRQST